MSDVMLLAIVSVVVTGIGAPGISAFSGRMETRRSHRLAVQKECRDVLDFAAEQLTRSQLVTAYCISLWSRGIMDGDDEAKEYLKRRNHANEMARTAYGRLRVRFGPTAPVTRHYDDAIECMHRLTDVLRGYRAGDTYGAWEHQASAESAELATAGNKFLTAAKKALSAQR